MKLLNYLILFSACCMTALGADIPSQKTEKNLNDARTLFYFKGFDNAGDFLTHWMYGDGSKLSPGKSLLTDYRVYQHLKKQQEEIINAVKRDLGTGKYKEGKTYVINRESSLKRFADSSDFTMTIGGCYIATNATIKIGKKNNRGKIPCEIIKWQSVLTDEYKFDKSDSYNIAGIGFKKGELYEYERAGHAENFAIKSSAFWFKDLLITFNL